MNQDSENVWDLSFLWMITQNSFIICFWIYNMSPNYELLHCIIITDILILYLCSQIYTQTKIKQWVCLKCTIEFWSFRKYLWLGQLWLTKIIVFLFQKAVHVHTSLASLEKLFGVAYSPSVTTAICYRFRWWVGNFEKLVKTN